MKLNSIDIIGQFADLKDNDYKNLLAINALVDILIEKGLFTRDDFFRKAQELDDELEESITIKNSSNHRQSLYVVPNDDK